MMRKSRLTDKSTIGIVQEAENGARPMDICRQHDIAKNMSVR